MSQQKLLQQTTDTVFMVRPLRFDLNAETANTNYFQNTNKTETPQDIQNQALNEFNDFADLLKQAGVKVVVFDDTPEPHTPDSIFPNNWISTHRQPQKMLITYPMHATNRRTERRTDIIEHLKNKYNFTQITDFHTQNENQNTYLEGTGSLVLDRINRIAYACTSPRTNLTALKQWCKLTNYTPIHFEATDLNKKEIYHTNVMLCIGSNFAVICTESIKNETQKQNVIQSLEKTNHAIIDISLTQMSQFAGNMLQLHNTKKEPILVMSEQAYETLTPDQREMLGRYNHFIIPASIYTIEKYGGGSARCMLAEIFY